MSRDVLDDELENADMKWFFVLLKLRTWNPGHNRYAKVNHWIKHLSINSWTTQFRGTLLKSRKKDWEMILTINLLCLYPLSFVIPVCLYPRNLVWRWLGVQASYPRRTQRHHYSESLINEKEDLFLLTPWLQHSNILMVFSPFLNNFRNPNVDRCIIYAKNNWSSLPTRWVSSVTSWQRDLECALAWSISTKSFWQLKAVHFGHPNPRGLILVNADSAS